MKYYVYYGLLYLFVGFVFIIKKEESKVARLQYQRLTEPMFYLLLSVIKENHGYAMMHDIQMLSHNRVKVGNGTMYNLLDRFMKDGIIELKKSSERKKYYQITEKGLDLLKQERECLQQQIEDSKFIDELIKKG